MVKFFNKIKILLLAAVAIATAVAVISCEKAVTAEEIVYPHKSKTILVYFVANNNLVANAIADIKEIMSGYVPDDGNLLVYCNNMDFNTHAILDTLPLLLNITKNEAGAVVADTVYKFAAQNSATRESLKSALLVSKTLFPSDSYGLILWSHGTGWLPSGYYSSGSFSSGTLTQYIQERSLQIEALRDLRRVNGEDTAVPFVNTWPSPPGGVDPYADRVKSFGLDGDTELEIIELAKGIPFKLDFLAFDACLMGDIATAYQLKDSTDYIMFSPAEVLTYGYPYSSVLQPLFAGNYDAAAQAYFNYYSSLSGDNCSCTISVIKTSELSEVAAQAKLIFSAYRDNIKSLDLSGIQAYFRYDKHWFYDLNDFIVALAGKSAAAPFTAALNNAVVAKYTTGKMLDLKIDETKFSGVSTYINNPADSELDAFFQTYAWEKAVYMTQAPSE